MPCQLCGLSSADQGVPSRTDTSEYHDLDLLFPWTASCLRSLLLLALYYPCQFLDFLVSDFDPLSVLSACVPHSSWFSPSCLSLRGLPNPHFCFCTDSCQAAQSQGRGSHTPVHSGWRASQGLALTLLPCDNCLQPASGFQGQRVGHRAM